MEVIRPSVRLIVDTEKRLEHSLSQTSVFLQFQLGGVKHEYNNET